MLVWIAKLRSWINDPNNQPQIQTASIAQLSNVAEEDVAATNAEALEDAARPTRTELATLPSAPSDGLLSLQVEVPASVSDRTIKRDSTESNLPYHSQNGSVSSSRAVESTPTDTPLVTAGLLPPLIPQPPASAEPAELATMPDSAEVMPFQQSWSGSNAKQDEDMVAREPGFPAPVSDTQAMQPIGVARRQIGPKTLITDSMRVITLIRWCKTSQRRIRWKVADRSRAKSRCQIYAKATRTSCKSAETS